MNYKILSLDETGKANYNHGSKYFVVSGIVVKEEHRKELKEIANKVIFKYFGDKKMVFHFVDMIAHQNGFELLNDTTIEKKFWDDFFKHVFNKNYLFFYVVSVNKILAKTEGKYPWETETILQRCYEQILKNFALHLKQTKYQGKIIAESSSDQDPYLVKVHSAYQQKGVGSTISGKEYFNLITSLSLVTKQNDDIETQIADIVATVGRIKQIKEDIKRIRKTIKDPVEQKKEIEKLPQINPVEQRVYNEFLLRKKIKGDFSQDTRLI